MAEIRINSTGELKLYDSDDSNYVSFKSGGTVSSNVTWTLPTADGSSGQMLSTDGSGTLSWATPSSADPSSADGDSLGTASAEWSDLYLADGGIVYFGNDQDIRLTHNADKGLIIKHSATADDKPVSLTLQTGETDIAASDVIGKIDFQAPDEGTGTDAILVAAGIEAVSEGDFSSSNNATKLSFKTAASEAAAEKMSLSSTGVLTTSGDVVAGSGSVRNRPNAGPIWFNGNMHVSQRGDSTGVTNGGSAYYACDRYKLGEDGTMSAVLTVTQETLTDGAAFTTDGHTRALKYDVTTADTSVGSDIYARITQRFEKQDLQLIKKGTANAQIVTLAFWVKATVTGTNVVEFEDQTNTRHCCATYTISSSNTWEHKVVTFAADTSTGDPFGTGNGLAADINFVLQAGSDYTSGTLATSWADITAANRAAGHNSNHFSSTSNNFHLTGIQLEVGEYTSSTLPPFQHETYGNNLQRCQRYYWNTVGAAYSGGGQGVVGGATQAQCIIECPVPMRTNPTGSIAGSGGVELFDGSASPAISSIGSIYGDATDGKFLVDINGSSGGMTAGRCAIIYSNNSATSGLAWSAEL